MENQKQPLVSVVIPTYNRIHTLLSSVDSVLKQSYENLELIVMDDGSTDGTEECVKRIADERVIYRKSEKNMGPSAARNMGAKLARGEYLAFQDSDDEWKPDKLEKQMKFMLDNQDVDLVYCEYEAYRDGRLLGFVPPRTIPYEEKQGNLFSQLLLEPLIGTPTMLMKKQEFIKEGGFTEGLKTFEDYEFSLRFSRSRKIGFVAEPLVRVNSSPNSVDKRYEERIHTQFYMVREMLEPLREQKLLEQKLQIIFNTAASLLCHDIFIEEMNYLLERLLTGEEKESAALFLKKMEQDKETAYLKMEIKEKLPKFKQKVLQIYMEFYENRASWTKETQVLLKQMVSSVEAYGKVFTVPEYVQECHMSIQQKLGMETITETDRLYLLADIVELFEMLEKL